MGYTKIWIHLVWATKKREPVLAKSIRRKLFRHMRQNAKEKSIHIDFINGYVEHVHVLVSLHADQCVSKTVQLLKGESSHWINKNKITPGYFEWQDDYFAVSVSESDVNRVREYIKNQEQHHDRKSFQQEFEEFIRRFGFVLLQDSPV